MASLRCVRIINCHGNRYHYGAVARQGTAVDGTCSSLMTHEDEVLISGLGMTAPSFFLCIRSNILSYTDVVAIDTQTQRMIRRATAYSAHQRVDAEPTLSSREQMSAVDAQITPSPSERGSFAAFQKIFNRTYDQFYVSHDVNVDLNSLGRFCCLFWFK